MRDVAPIALLCAVVACQSVILGFAVVWVPIVEMRLQHAFSAQQTLIETQARIINVVGLDYFPPLP